MSWQGAGTPYGSRSIADPARIASDDMSTIADRAAARVAINVLYLALAQLTFRE
jgi:hypothetical protein